jgi:hypothetical protein
MMGLPTQPSGRGVSACHQSRWWGLVCHGKLSTSLLVIIRQDLAPRASCGVNSFLELLMPAIHQ